MTESGKKAVQLPDVQVVGSKKIEVFRKTMSFVQRQTRSACQYPVAQTGRWVVAHLRQHFQAFGREYFFVHVTPSFLSMWDQKIPVLSDHRDAPATVSRNRDRPYSS